MNILLYLINIIFIKYNNNRLKKKLEPLLHFNKGLAYLVAQLVKDLPAMPETWVQSLVGKIPWRRERLPTPVFWPGEFHGLYSPWGRKESIMPE